MAGITLRAPDGSIMVTLTTLSKTEGGPSVYEEDTAVDGAAAAAMLRRAAVAVTVAEAARRAALKIEEESMMLMDRSQLAPNLTGSIIVLSTTAIQRSLFAFWLC